MYLSSGPQCFRTTTGIQSGPDNFNESRFVVNFLIILGVMEILCSFRLILEGKTGKEILEIPVAGNVFSKQLCFIRCRRQHLRSAEQRRYNRSLLLLTLLAICLKVPRT